jgi:hypothetical protein
MGIAYNEEQFIKHASQGDVDVVRLFLAAGMQENQKAGEEAAYQAAKSWQVSTAAAIIGTLKDRGNLAILKAMSEDDGVSLDNLLQAGADMGSTADAGKYGGAVLRAAASLAHLGCVRVLISKHVDVNAPDTGGDAPLHSAALLGIKFGDRQKTRSVAAALLAAGGDPNVKDKSGLTAVDYASGRGGSPGDPPLLAILTNRPSTEEKYEKGLQTSKSGN